MSVSEEDTRKATGRVKNPLKYSGYTNLPRYHSYRLHTCSNCTNKMKLDVTEHVKWSIQEYKKCTPDMIISRGAQDIRIRWGQKSATASTSMFEEFRDQLVESWNEE